MASSSSTILEHVGIDTIFWALKAFNDLNGLTGWNVLNRRFLRRNWIPIIIKAQQKSFWAES